jgi:hypothetical protein
MPLIQVGVSTSTNHITNEIVETPLMIELSDAIRGRVEKLYQELDAYIEPRMSKYEREQLLSIWTQVLVREMNSLPVDATAKTILQAKMDYGNAFVRKAADVLTLCAACTSWEELQAITVDSVSITELAVPPHAGIPPARILDAVLGLNPFT